MQCSLICVYHQLSFIIVYFVCATETLARLSIIFLYYRLFSIQSWLGRALKTVAALSILWLVIVIFGVAFHCKPVAAAFDASVKGECLDAQNGFLITESANLGLDLVLLGLPVRSIWKLRLPLKDRFGIVGIFLAGSLYVFCHLAVAGIH